MYGTSFTELALSRKRLLMNDLFLLELSDTAGPCVRPRQRLGSQTCVCCGLEAQVINWLSLEKYRAVCRSQLLVWVFSRWAGEAGHSYRAIQGGYPESCPLAPQCCSTLMSVGLSSSSYVYLVCFKNQEINLIFGDIGK